MRWKRRKDLRRLINSLHDIVASALINCSWRTYMHTESAPVRLLDARGRMDIRESCCCHSLTIVARRSGHFSLSTGADRPERLNAKQSTSLHTKHFLQYLELVSERAHGEDFTFWRTSACGARNEMKKAPPATLRLDSLLLQNPRACSHLAVFIHFLLYAHWHTRGRRLFHLIFACRRLETPVMILLTAGSHRKVMRLLPNKRIYLYLCSCCKSKMN